MMRSTTSPSPVKPDADRGNYFVADLSSDMISPFQALKNAIEDDEEEAQQHEEYKHKSTICSPSPAATSMKMMKSPITAMKLLTASIQYMEEPIINTPQPRIEDEENIGTQIMMLSMSSNDDTQPKDDDKDLVQECLVGLVATFPSDDEEDEEEDPLFSDLREQSYFSDLRHQKSSLLVISDPSEKSFPPTTTPGDKQPPKGVPSILPCSSTLNSTPAAAPLFTSPITSTTTKKASMQHMDLKRATSPPRPFILAQAVPSLFTSPIAVSSTTKQPKQQQQQQDGNLEDQHDKKGQQPNLSFNLLSPILPLSTPACCKKPPSQLETNTLFLSPITASNLDTTKASNVGLYQNYIASPDSSSSSCATSSSSSSSSEEEKYYQELPSPVYGSLARQLKQPPHSNSSDGNANGFQREEAPKQTELVSLPAHDVSVQTLVEEQLQQEDDEEAGYQFVDVDLEASRCDMIIEPCNQQEPLSLLMSPGGVIDGLEDQDGEPKPNKAVAESSRGRSSKRLEESGRGRRRFLDSMEIQYDIEEGHPLPPPPRRRLSSTSTADPIFEFAIDSPRNNTERDNRRITVICVCILVLVGALASGGVSFLVSGIGEKEGEIRFVYKPKKVNNSHDDGSKDDDDYYPIKLGNGAGENDPILLPTRNFSFTDDDRLGWDCKDTDYQEYFLRKVVRKVVSDRTALRTPGSPQHRALEWLIQTDGPALCPSYYWDEDHTSLIQRYILGVFYFSTGGKNWRKCSAPTYFASERNVAKANSQCQPLQSYYSPKEEDGLPAVAVSRTGYNNHSSSRSDAKAFAWLTSAPECHWGGVSCNEFGEIVELV